jgi:hypothetical protein
MSTLNQLRDSASRLFGNRGYRRGRDVRDIFADAWRGIGDNPVHRNRLIKFAKFGRCPSPTT